MLAWIEIELNLRSKPFLGNHEQYIEYYVNPLCKLLGSISNKTLPSIEIFKICASKGRRCQKKPFFRLIGEDKTMSKKEGSSRIARLIFNNIICNKNNDKLYHLEINNIGISLNDRNYIEFMLNESNKNKYLNTRWYIFFKMITENYEKNLDKIKISCKNGWNFNKYEQVLRDSKQKLCQQSVIYRFL